VRRITTLAITLVAAMAAMATTAQAAVYGPDGNPCPQVQVSGSTITGGCHIENLEGSWKLLANGGTSVVTECPLTFDLRVSTNGVVPTIYAVNQVGGTCSAFQRQPCTNPATGATIPWTLQVSNVGLPYGPYYITLNMCFELTGNPGNNGQIERVAFNVSQDNDGYLTGLTSYGSGHGLISAEFDNVDHGEGREMRIAP
jgi:hypothetical protein